MHAIQSTEGRLLRITAALVVLILTAWPTAVADHPGDILLRTHIDEADVDAELFIPRQSIAVRGILVHAVHYKLSTHDRWATLCRELKFAHLVTSIDLKTNNRPRRLREAMLAALDEFAARTGRKELPHVPRAGVGMSAGGMCIPMLIEQPDKMLTNAVSCSWVTDPAKIGPEKAAIPEMYVIGAISDGFKMLPAIDRFYVPAVKAGRPWALGLQHGCAHDWANSGTLFLPWIRAIAELRLPEQMQPGEAVILKDVSFGQGWRGDRSTIDGQFATIIPAAEYRGRPGDVVWLPNRAVACVWRAFQTKDSPVHLTAQTGDGSVKLPKFNPRVSFGMTARSGSDIVLGVNVKALAVVGDVRFFQGEQLIGRLDDPADVLTWRRPRDRAYAVWAQYELDGRQAVTNPALICIEQLD